MDNLEKIESTDDRYYLLLKKQNMLMKLILGVLAGIFLTIGISAVIVVPKVVDTLENANVAAKKATATLSSLEGIQQDLAKVSKELAEADIPGLVADTRTMVTGSTETMETAMEKLNGVDFESLNSAIVDLKSVIEPLAFLFK